MKFYECKQYIHFPFRKTTTNCKSDLAKSQMIMDIGKVENKNLRDLYNFNFCKM